MLITMVVMLMLIVTVRHICVSLLPLKVEWVDREVEAYERTVLQVSICAS